ncbi:MAG: DNA polymerase, partial [Fusobacteriaceae bacterium]
YSPSLQNLPSHYKNYILPLEEGHSIFELDVVSAEIIALGFISGENKIFEILSEKRDLYAFIGANVFSKTESEITPQMRKVIKGMTNGINLGMVGSSVAKLLNNEKIVLKKLTPRQGELIKQRYQNLFPRIKEYLKEIMESDRLCTAHGHIINTVPSYKNMSFPGQNLVAALLKDAIIQLNENNLFGNVLNIVHDSFIISCSEDQIEKFKFICQEVFMQMIPADFQDKNIDLLRLTKIERGGK